MKHKNISQGKKQHAQADSSPASEMADTEPASGADGNNSGGHGGNPNHQKTPPEPPSFWKNPNHWIAVATVVIAIANGLYTYFASQQWSVMRGQLQEMKDNSSQAEITLGRELRPYISVRTLRVVGEISQGKKFHGTADMVNTGRTPAVDMQSCGDVFVTPFDKPITDDWPCPSPGNPIQPTPGERSTSVLGAGLSIPIDSPGTTGSIQPIGLDLLLLQKKFRVYFEGYVNYRDILTQDSTIHHTTFCGLYSPELRAWTVCEKHNRMD